MFAEIITAAQNMLVVAFALPVAAWALYSIVAFLALAAVVWDW